ncbi:hypothetical protein JTB14_003741 [Gonioctena quinquepunctata]|nr:hypothetical protein JTB14_003741 [Gonioctena quinquepunctata]
MNQTTKSPSAIPNGLWKGLRCSPQANKNGYGSLRAELASRDEAFQVLKGKSKLKGSNVFIDPDYTRKQQELNKSAQQKLIQRRSNDEVVHIKYIKGIPQVVTKNWLTNIHRYPTQTKSYLSTIKIKDRTQETSSYARGGGVLIAVHKDIKSQVLLSSPNYEYLFVLIGQGINLIIFAEAYFPPKSSVAAYIQ